MRFLALVLLVVSTGCSSAGETCASSGDCWPWLACKGNVCIDEGDQHRDKASRGVLEARAAAEMYRINKKGDCPGTSALKAARLLDEPNDPWGQPYEVICGEGIVVRSNGADREAGTSDDVYSESDDRERLAKRIVKELAHQAAHGKRWHTCPATIDPWGEKTSGTCDNTGATITSAGPDREHGTGDDVSARADAPDE